MSRRLLPIRPCPRVVRRARLAVALFIGLAPMAACAPHIREVELPGTLCEDDEGFEAPCETELDAWLRTLPEESEAQTPALFMEELEPSDELGRAEVQDKPTDKKRVAESRPELALERLGSTDA